MELVTCTICGKEIELPDDKTYEICPKCGNTVKPLHDRRKRFQTLEKATQIYEAAKEAMQEAKSESAYKKAAWLFESIPGYEDADQLAAKCHSRAKAAGKFKKLLKVSFACVLIVLIVVSIALLSFFSLRSNYLHGVSHMERGKYEQAILYFSKAGNYKDGKELLSLCQKRIDAYASSKQMMLNGNFRGAVECLVSVGITVISIPDTITVIPENAFAGCTDLVGVHFNFVTVIGSSAFKGCTGLTSFPTASVTRIEDSAFEGCTGLTSIYSADKLQYIGKSAFKGCTALTSVSLYGKLQSIGPSAFEGCTSLNRIRYMSNYTAWYNIKKGSNWNLGVPATEVVYPGGTFPLQ